MEVEGSPATGRRRVVGDGRVPIWLGIPFFLMGLLSVVVGWGALRDEQAFGEAGVAVQGVVASLYTTSGENSTTYHVEYTFTVPGTGAQQRGTGNASRSVWNQLQVGDSVTVTYLPADPGKHRLGSPEPDLAGPLLPIGVGALFALVGPILFVVAIRQRRAASATGGAPAGAEFGPLGAAALPGAMIETSSAERRRVDTFTRSWVRVLGEVVVAPAAGVAFLLLAVWSLGQLSQDGSFFGLAMAAGFIGTLVLVTGIDGLRRGPSRRLLEVGPDGLWLAPIGRLAWAEVAEVRLEEYHGLRRRGAPVRRIDVLPDGREIDSATRSVFRRIGIVPRDPALARHADGRLMRSLTRGISEFANRTRRDGVTTEDPDVAPFGIGAYEVQPSIEAVIASIRRFVPVVDRLRLRAGESAAPALPMAASPSESWPPATVSEDGPLSDGELRDLDARLGPGADRVPAPAASIMPAGLGQPPTLVAQPTVPRPQQPRRRVFRRRGFTATSLLSLVLPNGDVKAPPIATVVALTIGGILFTVVPLSLAASVLGGSNGGNPIVGLGVAAVGVIVGVSTLRSARRQWRLVSGDDELLAVGPEGLTVRGANLPWSAIENVTLDDGVLAIRPRSGAGTPTKLSLGLFEDDTDVIVDEIARYRIVDET